MKELDPGFTDLSLPRLVNASLAEARAAGRDWIGQTDRAVRTVLTVRPDLTASGAINLVDRLRNRDPNRGPY